MSSEEIRIPITPEEIPRVRKHNWYILIYSIKEGNETKNEMINALKDVPFIILGSDRVGWLENVELLIIPDEGLRHITHIIEISGIPRIAPMQVSIETVYSNLKVSMIDDFYKRMGLTEVETDIETNLTRFEEEIKKRKVEKEELSGIEREITKFKADVDRLEEYDCTEHKNYTGAKKGKQNTFWERYSRIVAHTSHKRAGEMGP